MKETYQKKYRPNQPEDLHSNGKVNRLAFVSRIVNTENKPLSVKEAWSLTNKRDAKDIGLNQTRFGAALSAAVRGGRLDKTRIQETPTKSVVKYHPLDMKPMGLDIPVPFYKRGAVDESVYFHHTHDDVFTFDASRFEEDKTDAIIADIAGLPTDDDEWEDDDDDAAAAWSPKPTAEEVAKWGEDYEPSLGVTRLVKVEGGFVEMQNDIVLGFTTSIVGHLAEALFVEHHVAEQKIIEALNSVNTLGRAELVRALRNLVVKQ